MSSSSGKGHRKPRSKSQDGSTTTLTRESASTLQQKGKKTRSKSHDDAIASSGVRKMKRNGSLKKSSSGLGSGGLSLEDGLSKVAVKSSLLRKDLGRGGADDDDDTFCGTGTVDGEVKRGKLHMKNNKSSRPNPFGGARADPFAGKSAFGGRRDDSDSEEDDEVDFFAGASNPFKDLKKKNASRRTAL